MAGFQKLGDVIAPVSRKSTKRVRSIVGAPASSFVELLQFAGGRGLKTTAHRPLKYSREYRDVGCYFIGLVLPINFPRLVFVPRRDPLSCVCVRVPLQIARAASLRQSTATREISVHSRATVQPCAIENDRRRSARSSFRLSLARHFLSVRIADIPAAVSPSHNFENGAGESSPYIAAQERGARSFVERSWKDASKRRLPPTRLTFHVLPLEPARKHLRDVYEEIDFGSRQPEGFVEIDYERLRHLSRKFSDIAQ